MKKLNSTDIRTKTLFVTENDHYKVINLIINTKGEF